MTCKIFDYKKIKIERGKFIEKYNMPNSNSNCTLNTDLNREHFKRFNLEEGANFYKSSIGNRKWNFLEYRRRT